MVKPKVQSKKQQKRGSGIDFKKIKRKIGRKLPPPKNATNTEIKSKAIVLPEQSIVSEKAGLAVSKKGLTLKELLQQTSHHNAKVRRDALLGIKEILLKHPQELKLHKLAVIEKLRERISDEDKVVRETLYQLFKSVVFPGCKEDNQGSFISLMVTYIFSAMTHLAIDVRLMAFKFFDLVIEYYPSSFSMYADKILQNYEDILQKNQFYLQDKGKLKSTLSGLVRCLSLLPCIKEKEDLSTENDFDDGGILLAFRPDTSEKNTGLSGIIDKLKVLLPILVGCIQDFTALGHTMSIQDTLSFDCMMFILQSIDLVVKFFVYGAGSYRVEMQNCLSTYGGSNIPTHAQIVSPVMLKKLWDLFPLNTSHNLSEKDDDRYFMLNVVITEIFLRLSDCGYPSSALLDKFLVFIESSLSEKIHSRKQVGELLHERHLLSIVPFIPKLIMHTPYDWKTRILQAFTNLFKSCSPESPLKLACLNAIEEMLVPEHGWLYRDANFLELVDHQIVWIRELFSLLILMGDKNPSFSKAILRIQLQLGHDALINSSISHEYDNMQHVLKDFYCTYLQGNMNYGPFVRLERDIQELSLCCLYYFSFLDSELLLSVGSCCLCPDMEPSLTLRILEVLHSVYKAGHMLIEDYVSFLITLLKQFEVYPEEIHLVAKEQRNSNRGTYRSVTGSISSFLSQIGDDHLVLQMLENVFLDQISLGLPVENMCALLRLLISLDSEPTRLSEQSILRLGHILPEYLLLVMSNLQADSVGAGSSLVMNRIQYYILPCLFLFYRCHGLLNIVLNVMGSISIGSGSVVSPHDHAPAMITCSSRLNAIASLVFVMHKYKKMQPTLKRCKAEILNILQNILRLQSAEEGKMILEEKHKLQRAYERLETLIGTSSVGYLQS